MSNKSSRPSYATPEKLLEWIESLENRGRWMDYWYVKNHWPAGKLLRTSDVITLLKTLRDRNAVAVREVPARPPPKWAGPNAPQATKRYEHRHLSVIDR